MSVCKTPLISALFLSLRSTHLENIFQCSISCFNLSRRDIASFFFYYFAVVFLFCFAFVLFFFFFVFLLFPAVLYGLNFRNV